MTADEIRSRLVSQATQNTPQEQKKVSPVTKTYFCRVPNSCFHVMRGPGICEVVAFRGTTFETDDAEIIEHLEKVANKPGSPIYTQHAKQDAFQADTKLAALDMKALAEAAVNKLDKAGVPRQ